MWHRATLLRATLLTGSALLVTACGAAVGPSASASSASATATAVLIEPMAGNEEARELEAGTYMVDEPFPMRVSFTVPEGWLQWAYTNAASQVNLVAPDSGEISFEIIDNVSADPCTKELLDPPVGPSVDDLVTALSELNEFEVTPATDITVDGFTGKHLTMTAPAAGACELSTWRTTTRQNGVGHGEVNDVQILDVNGDRLVVSVAHGPALSAEAQSKIDAVLESIQIGE
jgi:hypothetical protein